MRLNLFLAIVIPVILGVIAIVIFLAFALPHRHDRPLLLDNGYSFFIEFVLAMMTYLIYPITLLPLSLVASLIVLFIPAKKAKGIVFSATAGGLAGYASTLLWLYVINTFSM